MPRTRAQNEAGAESAKKRRREAARDSRLRRELKEDIDFFSTRIGLRSSRITLRICTQLLAEGRRIKFLHAKLSPPVAYFDG